jgi:carboxypeptidase Q
MRKILFLFAVLSSGVAIGQSQDEATIQSIFDKALSEGKSYSMLEYLTTHIGARLSGSPGAAAAVDWTRQEMENFCDTVWLQPVMVPHWVRGQKEIGRVINSKKKGTLDFNVCALGMSVGTGPSGVSGNVVEVKSFAELKQLGEKNIKGKIVFFNRPMDVTKLNTFSAYMGAVDQRGGGASEAAKYGAVGVIVRSMGTNPETYPHTGALGYQPLIPQIPAIAIATQHADQLSKMLREEKDLQFYFETHCELLEDAPSYNVIGEIAGSEYPDEVIVVGGHLDSWDLGQGAHDDGAGCVHAMEVLRLFKIMGYKPKHTIRAVMFMNEENGLRGGTAYARQVALKKEKHIAAIESDRGGFTPRGFSMTGTDAARATLRSWKPLLAPYGLTDFSQIGGGADISPLETQGVPTLEFVPDPQRYFDYHHTREDTFDKISRRELALGAASMAALTYLIDRYGLK